MDVRIESKDAFKIAGISMDADPSANFTGLWDDLFGTVPCEQLQQFGSGQSYGVCYDWKEGSRFRYMAGYDVGDPAHAQACGLEVLLVPSAKYAVVQLIGPVPACIRDGWAFLLESFFPEHGFVHAGTPDFEMYADGDMSQPDYRMELWVPVEQVFEA